MYTVGIDAGSRAMKLILMHKESREIVQSAIIDQGINQNMIAQNALQELIEKAGIKQEQIDHIVATGYGREVLSFADSRVTEITCHGFGVYFLHRDAKTVIDIGGQDSKVLHLGTKGKVTEFSMNDRCAAGTGRFLEVVSERLSIPLTSIGKTAAAAVEPSSISSMCVVFAETEIIGLLAQGVAKESIIAGVCGAIGQRLRSMAGKKIEEPIYFTGGVSVIKDMDRILSGIFGLEIRRTESAQLTGAIGAALIGTTK